MRLNYELFNGVSVQFNNLETAPGDAAKIAAMPEVKHVSPMHRFDAPQRET